MNTSVVLTQEEIDQCAAGAPPPMPSPHEYSEAITFLAELVLYLQSELADQSGLTLNEVRNLRPGRE